MMIMIMLLRWWWWLSWQRSSWPSCSITLRQGTRVDLLVTPLLHCEPHLDENHCWSLLYLNKSRISILEKSPGPFFSTLTHPPPSSPSHPWKVRVIICGQAVRRTVLSCYTAIEPLSNHHCCCVFFVIPFCCFHKSPLSVCVLHVSFFSVVHCFVKLRRARHCALCVPIADYLSIIATVLESHHSNASILFSSSFFCCCFLSFIPTLLSHTPGKLISADRPDAKCY